MKKRYVFELKVAVLLLVVAGTVSFTGWLAYERLSSITNTLSDEIRPNAKLLTITEISSRITDAESSVSTYTLTQEINDLKPYHETVSSINDKIEDLYELTENNEVQTAQVDTIHNLIQQKLWIWNEMLSLSGDNRLKLALDELSKNLETKVDTQITESKNSFFKRIFSGEKKSVDTVIHKIKPEDVRSEIDTIEVKENQIRARRNAKELQLIQQNRRITKALNTFISKFENAERAALARKTDQADQMAAETNRYIAFFSITAAILLLIVFFVILNYVRKTNAYEKALQKAKNEAEDLSMAKERFVANMSHEIRTPMNAIIGFTKQLLKQNKDQSLNEPLKMIDHAGEHLLQMINDILDISKLNTGNIKVEQVHFDPADLFGNIHKLFEPLTKEKPIEFTYDCSTNLPEALKGDPFRLKQIVMNLVSNAIKFTSEGYVHVSVWTENKKQQSLDVKFMVVDTGIGIPQDKQQDIFDDFAQAEQNTTRLYGGTGLGLSIVKKLVELLHGHIELNSHPGEGTEFIVTIPFSIGDVTQLEQSSDDIQPDIRKIENISVLLADDEEYNRRLITFILKNWQVHYREVTNGKEALEEVQQNHYDVILMDVRMPDMDGLTATQKIRALGASEKSQIPVIAITAGNSQQEIEACQKAGMNTFMSKPFTEDKLYHTISRLLLKDNGKNEMAGTEKARTEPDRKNGQESKIRLGELKRMAGGDEKFVHEMLQMFITNSQEAIKKTEACLTTGKDFETIAEEAHKLASPCRHLGLTQLVTWLKQLEKEAFEKKDTKAIQQLFTNIKKELNETCHQIQEDVLAH